MDEKRIQQVVDKMLKQGSEPDTHILSPNGGIATNEPSQIEVLATVIKNLEMGLIHVAQSQQSMGIALDTARLTNRMLVQMLVEKKVFDEEEIKAKYQTEVIDKIKEMQNQIQEQMKAEFARQKAEEDGIKCNDCDCVNHDKECSDCNTASSAEDIEGPTNEVQSNVVLPSERAGNVVRFPTTKE